MIPNDLESFISENNLQQHYGLPEYYSQDGLTRIVIIGESARMDIKTKKNWSNFKSMIVFGKTKRTFRVHGKDTRKKRVHFKR